MDLLIIRNLRRRRYAARNRMRAARLYLREKYDPFEKTTEEEFVKLFRLKKDICRHFISLIEPFMRERTCGLSKTTRILCAIRFFATGKYKLLNGWQFICQLIAYNKYSTHPHPFQILSKLL